MKGGGEKWNNFWWSKLKGAVIFPNVKIMVFVLFFDVCMCVFFKNTIKRCCGQCWALFCWGGAKSWANKWPTAGSISGPHFGSNF